MDFAQLVLLAVVQGVTEFLPISSSAHLILASRFFGMPDQGVLIDIALHFGSLFAVLIYFWRDIRVAVYGPVALVSDLRARRPLSWPAKIAVLLVIATAPLIPFYFALESSAFYDEMRDETTQLAVLVIGWTTLIYGVLLYVADRFSSHDLAIKDWSFGGALMMGAAQALSLIPGTSRSGVCMTMARALGFDRSEAARIALLMAVPAILAASAKGGYDLIKAGDLALTVDAVVAAALAFVSAYASIVLMMRWLARATFTPFVVYRIILAGFLLWTAYAPVS